MIYIFFFNVKFKLHFMIYLEIRFCICLRRLQGLGRQCLREEGRGENNQKSLFGINCSGIFKDWR